MKLARSTVVFKSTAHWYEDERAGMKPNTVRLMSPAEFLMLAEYDPAHVRIELAGSDGATCFTRKIVRIYQLAELLGQALVMVCWDPAAS
jgi:hypothetical protein